MAERRRERTVRHVPITSFTASLGHDGNIDIFALALSPQAQPGHGAAVFRIRQKKAGGDWRP